MYHQTILKFCLKSILILDIIIVLVLLIATLAVRLPGGHIYSVQSASMSPVLDVGDAVIVSNTSIDSLKTGEIISYRRPSEPSVIVSHRIESVDTKNQRIITAGDANSHKDPAIPYSAVVGRVVVILPGFGNFINSIRHPFSLAVLVYLPALILAYAEVERASRHLNRPRYQLQTHR